MAMSEQDAGVRPTRPVVGTRVRQDAASVEIVRLLGEIAKRVRHEPAVRPNPAGMVRLGSTDRASYVWFLKCPPDTRPGLDGQPMTTCNHGIGVDREHLGQWIIRAWAHGRPEVFSVEIHTGVVKLELLEHAAGMVGIPLEPKESKG
jgi:hypothetical protein